MKAATGELNLTLITIVALGLVLALFTTILWPRIRERLTASTDDFATDRDVNAGAGYNMEFTKYIETELF